MSQFDREFEELGRAEDAYLYGGEESELPTKDDVIERLGGSPASPAVGITEEMIEAAAEAFAGTRGPEELASSWRTVAAVALRAALAGRTVVELPEPNFTSNRPRWSWWGRDEHVQAQLHSDGTPAITIGGRLKSVEDAEQTAFQMLAAVRKARLASGSSESGEPNGD